MLHTSVLTQRAETFVKIRHAGQYRRCGEPFFNHLDRVATKVKDMGGSIDAITAAFLHDVVEDGKAKSNEISRLFGTEVYKIVCILTRRENMSYDDYIDSIVMSHNLDAIMIKLADNIDNLASCGDGAFSPEAEAGLKERWLKSKQKMELALC